MTNENGPTHTNTHVYVNVHTHTNIDCVISVADGDRQKIICHFCGKEFDWPSHLQAHVKRHMGEKNHVCPICQKRFSARSDLRKHMQIHTGERKFVCDICGGTFSGHMQRHMKTHEEGYQNPKPKKERKPKKLTSQVTFGHEPMLDSNAQQNETQAVLPSDIEIYEGVHVTADTQHIYQEYTTTQPQPAPSPVPRLDPGGARLDPGPARLDPGTHQQVSQQQMAQNLPPGTSTSHPGPHGIAHLPQHIALPLSHEQLASGVPGNYANLTAYSVPSAPPGTYGNVVPTTSGNNPNSFSTIQMAMANWMTFQPH